MKLKLLLLLITMSLAWLPMYAQQGPQFSQFMFNKLALNPAYAGADEHLSITTLSRRQWTAVDKGPTTQALSVHKLFRHRVGLGVALIHDRIGIHQYTDAMASYAYHIKLGKMSFASMGLQGGITTFRSNFPALNVSANDPKLMNYVKGVRANVGAGIYLRSPRFDMGLSAPGLMSRKVDFNDTLSVRFRNADVLLFGIYHARLNEKFSIEPGVLMKYFPGLSLSYDINTNVIYMNVLHVGLSYRANESVDAILKLQLTEKMQFGYAYDFPLKNAAIRQGASHELMIHYLFRKATHNIASPR